MRMQNKHTILNDYRRKRNKRLVKEVSERSPMSYVECIEQQRKLERQSRRVEAKGRRSTAA